MARRRVKAIVVLLPRRATKLAPILATTLSGWHEFWPVAPGSRRKDFVVGAETGAEWRIYIPGSTAPFPQTGLRLTSLGAMLSKSPLLRMTKPRDFLLALSQNRDS